MMLDGGKGKKETFTWKRSSGPEVQALQGKSHGMKLVRVRDGKVVAAWTEPSSGRNKKGRLRFLGDKAELGERWEVLVVVTIVVILEKARRNNNSRSRGRGVTNIGAVTAMGAGAGASAGGGGGGC